MKWIRQGDQLCLDTGNRCVFENLRAYIVPQQDEKVYLPFQSCTDQTAVFFDPELKARILLSLEEVRGQPVL